MCRHHVELPDRTCGKHLFGFDVNDRADALASDLQNPMVDAGGLDHLRTVGVLVNHRLLAINVLPCLHGVHRNLLVPVIGSADDYRVYIFSRQEFL